MILLFNLTVNIDSLPVGAEVVVDGLGVFANKTSTPIDDDVLINYEAANGPIIEHLSSPMFKLVKQPKPKAAPTETGGE